MPYSIEKFIAIVLLLIAIKQTDARFQNNSIQEQQQQQSEAVPSLPKWFAYCHFSTGESDIEILSCNRCLEFETDNNKNNNPSGKFCSYYTNATLYNSTSSGFLPTLAPTWFHVDLLAHILTDRIETNLVLNYTDYARIARSLFTIQLNNMDIEQIDVEAFSHFYRLKILNLAQNNIKYIQLSAFSFVYLPQLDVDQGFNENATLTNDTSSIGGNVQMEKVASNLVELDFSFNHIASIRMENNAMLKDLLVFNVSNNYIEAFDLRFFAIIAPRLEMLDLGNNYLKKFQIFNNYLIIKSLKMPGNKPFSLIKNLIASNLIDLNLNDNYISDFNELLSIDKNSINDRQFCFMKRYEFKGADNAMNRLALPRGFKEEKLKKKENHFTLDIHIKNNAWTCNCETYEILSAIFYQIQHLNQSRNLDVRYMMSQKYANSCYLNYLINLNKYMFENFLDNIESLGDLSCYSKEPKAASNWLMWYTKECVKFTEAPTTVTKVPMSMETTTRSMDWLITYGQHFNTTTTNPVFKYDISNSFYWICSLCIAIIALSCVFIGWFYCWKRYALTKRIHLLQRRNLQITPTSGGLHPPNSRLRSAATGNRQQRARHFRPSSTTATVADAYILNSRMYTGRSEDLDTSTEALALNRNQANFRAIMAHSNRHTINTNPNGLYYISLNRNLPNRGIRFDENNLNVPITSGNYYDNGAYMNVEDEPPNYYEAVQIKSRVPNLVINKSNPNGTVIELSEINLSSFMNDPHREMTEAHSETSSESNSTRDSSGSESYEEANDGRVANPTESLQEDDEATLNDVTMRSTMSLGRTESIEPDFSQDSLDRHQRRRPSGIEMF